MDEGRNDVMLVEVESQVMGASLRSNSCVRLTGTVASTLPPRAVHSPLSTICPKTFMEPVGRPRRARRSRWLFWVVGNAQACTNGASKCANACGPSRTNRLFYRWPKYPTGPNAGPFPMAIVCTNTWQAKTLEVLVKLFQMICHFDLPRSQLFRAIDELASPRNPIAARALNENIQFTHFYPCLATNDGREAIYTTWCVRCSLI